ncbi:cytochrome P450 4c3 [Trichogramma pretiosum]|uniref:cytochrome P450 4c3 n=1 Tax=Trichogramma pretiosum TaxID=7493 RepID=UPI0006C9BF35|nr:cytochrome P450 4c3 [Trichogramma pretiosum]
MHSKCIFREHCNKIPICLTCTHWESEIYKLKIVLMLIFGVLLSRILQKWWCKKRRFLKYLGKIPGPLSMPLVGNLIQLSSDHAELFTRLMGMRLMWGSREGINKAWVGQMPYVFLSKASTVELILGTTRHIDKSSDYQYLRPWLGTGLLTSSGPKWHSRRKILTPTFHFNILDDFVQVFGEQTEILVKKLVSRIDEPPFNVFPLITLCTLDIICETAMGRRISAQNRSNSEYVKAILEMGYIIQTRQTSYLHSINVFFRMSSLYKKQKKCLEILHNFSKKVIAERRAEIMGNRTEIKKRLAFLDLLIIASENGSTLSDNDIREEVDTFMFEGHDTTSSSVCWTLFLLGCHLDIQEKVVNELNTIFSEGDQHRRPTMQDLKNMRYLEMCIKESLRLYPSVPLLGRRVGEDIQIGKYLVPKGSTATIIIPALHRDPEVFSNPESFDPERFSPMNCAKRHPYAYIPFSAGPRNCIGQKFAMLEEKAIISAVLRTYVVEAAERREDLSITTELVTRAENGLHIRIKRRSTH